MLQNSTEKTVCSYPSKNKETSILKCLCIQYELCHLEIARYNFQFMLKGTVKTWHCLTKQAAPPVSPGSSVHS